MMTGRLKILTVARLRALGLLSSSLALAAFECHALPAPTAPATSTGNYTVSYGSCAGCAAVWIEERPGAGSVWTAVGTSSATFTNKPAGAYDYRAALLFPDSSFQYAVEYSDTATVVVGSNLPVPSSLAQQFSDVYEARVGYYDGDSRPDLYLERTRGGDREDGTVYRLILRAVSGGFQPQVPSGAEVRAARTWPRAAVRLALHDVNLDGYVDVLIGRIGRLAGLAGTPAQIVLAPGRVASGVPKGVRSVSGDMLDAGRDLAGFLVEPRYFDANAPLRFVTVTYFDVSCQYTGFDSIYSFVDFCYPYPITSIEVVRDYSGFAAAAVRIADVEDRIVSGAVTAQTGYAEIEFLTEDILGAPIGDPELKALIGEADGTIDKVAERGMELFSALAGISNAVAQDADDGEEAPTGSTAPDAVLLTGRRIFGFGPFHTALQYGTSTISAHDDDPRALYDGRLVSQVDWPPDHPGLTLRLGMVSAPLPPGLYWQRLLLADSGYGDDLRYDAIPSIGAGGYNSNGFVAGIVAATAGITSEPMDRFVGGELPVPRSEFN